MYVKVLTNDSSICFIDRSMRTKSHFSFMKILIRRLLLFISLSLLIPLAGCGKRCNNFSILGMDFGMRYEYPGQPIDFLEETLFRSGSHRPDYPQKSVQDRIKDAVMLRFPLGSDVKPLVSYLEQRQFSCSRENELLRCWVVLNVAHWDRCNLFEKVSFYRTSRLVVIVLDNAPEVRRLTVEYKFWSDYNG